MVTEERVNPAFFEEMKRTLGADYPAYLAALSKPRERGLRANALKISEKELSLRLDLSRRVPFVKTGYFLGERKLGAHPYHHAGLFYLQEPSAMLPVAAIAPYLSGRILDLCAAPGGKSTQILCEMQPDSFLLCNETVTARCAALSSNLERMGALDAAVTNMLPKELERLLPAAFDAVIVDAPCSGEGMFRKEEASVRDWNRANVAACAARQSEILTSAAKMLKPGGVMVYSTCTLNTLENEGVILRFLETHPEFSPLEPRAEIRAVTDRGFGLPEAMRLFPHRFSGEGHFACLLQKSAAAEGGAPVKERNPFTPLKAEERRAEELLSSFGISEKEANLAAFRETVFLVSPRFFAPSGIRLYRGGIPVLKAGERRLEPLHGAALFLKKGQCERTVDLPWDSEEIARYLHGEQLSLSAPFTGYGVIAADGYPLGLVKSAGGCLKNHYPKGLRTGQ